MVITAVVVEGRSQSAVAREYGVSQGWISRLVARYRCEGDAAFEPRSRRPHTSPTRLPQTTIDLIVELRAKLTSKGLDNGPETIAWHLHHHHGLRVSTPSIIRHLRAAGLVTPAPKKRPKASYTRFAADLPNERWQADFTHWWLAHRSHVEILCWIDDHSRFALSVTAHRRVTGIIVRNTFRKPLLFMHSSINTDRQRHGLHHPIRRRQRRTQHIRSRTTPPRRGPINSPQPPDHLRESRTLPPNS